MTAHKIQLIACLFLFLALGLATPTEWRTPPSSASCQTASCCCRSLGKSSGRFFLSFSVSDPMMTTAVFWLEPIGGRVFDCQLCVDCCRDFTCIIRGEHCEQFNGFYCPVQLEECNRNCNMKCLV
ncbi:hypothetical protein SELMODRAFT_412329 [Selaginella moellendorffii]|uniref:Uncharacterized protein n=1 Tax=Selaginella moellendorffii TaxID=88036 RepID=D8RKT3_SELML|nr:hypothetical protein SELMODRAFT_412329 [Selaginella moellendorffii]